MAEEMLDQEDQRISEEYKIWKKNTPFLYDTVMTQALEWPSLTAQWLPCKGDNEQKMLLGTHTSDDETSAALNYLMIAKVSLPDEEEDAGDENPKADAPAAAGAAAPKPKIDPTWQRILHETEVNRARYMPQNPFFVATKGAVSDVFVFDTSKHPSNPAPNSLFSPDIRCKGHEKEGYGVAWSELNEGHLISGSEDNKVCHWDVKACTTAELEPTRVFEGHTSVVEDVEFHRHDPNVFGSVGDDKQMILWDIRQAKPTKTMQAHDGYVNSLSFNPVKEHLLATGSQDKTVALWDMRKLEQKLHTFVTHTDEVFSVEWAPFNDSKWAGSILASASADRRLNVWDLQKIGTEQTEEDKQDGPPELLFIHGGHTARISDFSWNPNPGCEWFLGSVAEDNVLQVWQMAVDIYDEDGEGESEAQGGDAAMLE